MTATSVNNWSAFLESLQGYGGWRDNPEVFDDLSVRLQRFTPSHEQTLEHIEVVMHSLARGYALMSAVADWENPYVGTVPTHSQSASSFRGIQWKLVMAYNAFEIIFEALMPGQYSSFSQRVTDFIQTIDLPNLESQMTPPDGERAVFQRWLGEAEDLQRGPSEELLDFLGLRNRDRKLFQGWLMGDILVDTWADEIALAKALRNMTAHGALSANKLREFGLVEPVATLTNILQEVVSAVILSLKIRDQSLATKSEI